MAAISCTSSGGKNHYACTGTAWGCARAIAKLKTLDQGSSDNSPEVAELRVVAVLPEPDDYVRVGLRRFPVDTYDVIVHEENANDVQVVVFERDQLIFRGKRPKRSVAYVPGDGSDDLPLKETLDAEEYVQIDIKDLEKRVLK